MNQNPPPVPNGECIPDALIRWMQSVPHVDEAVQLVRARDAFGRQKYGQPLRSKDGRDGVQDAMEELGDLLQYTFKSRINGHNVDKIAQLLPVLRDLLTCPREDLMRFLKEKQEMDD